MAAQVGPVQNIVVLTVRYFDSFLPCWVAALGRLSLSYVSLGTLILFKEKSLKEREEIDWPD